MSNGIVGTSTICTSIIPNFKALENTYPYKLSREAKLRLKVIDYYLNKSGRNASLTARYFGVSRTFVHKWLKRFKNNNLATLETRSRRPKHFRDVQYDVEVVNVIRKIRREYPTFSAVKISVLLALCAIDTYTKEAIIHICSKPTATNGSIAMQKVLDRFGTDITVVCDNGSENFGATFDLLISHNVRQIFARPHTPKDKPHIENFIGKYQKECLDESRDKCMTVEERQREADKWLNDWHFYRPHQALNYLTPAEYCATIGITILQAKSVSDVVS